MNCSQCNAEVNEKEIIAQDQFLPNVGYPSPTVVRCKICKNVVCEKCFCGWGQFIFTCEGDCREKMKGQVQEYFLKDEQEKITYDPEIGNKIIVRVIDSYLDGGTLWVRDDKTREDYFIDRRFGSPTYGEVFDKYPSDSGAEMLNIKLVLPPLYRK